MAGSLNRVTLIGNLGRDPESRSFQNGGKVVNLNLAVSESWKDRNSGERKERTEWITVAIFSEALCGVAEQYLRKGSKVYVEGKFTTRKWTDQQGNDRYSSEVHVQPFDGKLILLDKAERGDRREPEAAGAVGWGSGASDFDDEIPF